MQSKLLDIKKFRTAANKSCSVCIGKSCFFILINEFFTINNVYKTVYGEDLRIYIKNLTMTPKKFLQGVILTPMWRQEKFSSKKIVR